MIRREDLAAIADSTGLTAPVVEKDYVLGWLLHGIYRHPALRERWAFKGGTCLKKCYFETYRFSEDLDFTLLDPAHLDEAFLRAALQKSLSPCTTRLASNCLHTDCDLISTITPVCVRPVRDVSTIAVIFNPATTFPPLSLI